MTTHRTIIHLRRAVTLFMLNQVIFVIIHFVALNGFHVQVIVVVELADVSIIIAALLRGFLPLLRLIELANHLMVLPVVLPDLVIAEQAGLPHLDAVDPVVMHHGVVRNFEQALRTLYALKFIFCRNSVMIGDDSGILGQHPSEIDRLLLSVGPEELLKGMSFLIMNPRMRCQPKNSITIIALPLSCIWVMCKLFTHIIKPMTAHFRRSQSVAMRRHGVRGLCLILAVTRSTYCCDFGSSTNMNSNRQTSALHHHGFNQRFKPDALTWLRVRRICRARIILIITLYFSDAESHILITHLPILLQLQLCKLVDKSSRLLTVSLHT